MHQIQTARYYCLLMFMMYQDVIADIPQSCKVNPDSTVSSTVRQWNIENMYQDAASVKFRICGVDLARYHGKLVLIVVFTP